MMIRTWKRLETQDAPKIKPRVACEKLRGGISYQSDDANRLNTIDLTRADAHAFLSVEGQILLPWQVFALQQCHCLQKAFLDR
jgi:hypothetical protein